jgi:hypothetical protein
MPVEADWINVALARVREHSPEVPIAVWTNLEALRRGKFSQRQVSAVDLARDAKQLIDAMVPPPPLAGEPK